jgi:hypothetical protein
MDKGKHMERVYVFTIEGKLKKEKNTVCIPKKFIAHNSLHAGFSIFNQIYLFCSKNKSKHGQYNAKYYIDGEKGHLHN